jgi:carboxymethylenebutenolidase
VSDSMTTRTVELEGHGGDRIPAYLARPDDEGARGGVVVIHHMPGWDRSTKEVARRFAELGYDAICANLHHREAPGASPDDAAAAVRAAGGVPDERLLGDAGAAIAYLRGLPGSNGKVGVIGYCSGGRQSVLVACNLDVDAAVDCYGAFVTGIPPADLSIRVTNLEDQLPNLRCPLLGLFGLEDSHPSPEQVAELERILKENAKDFDQHSYEDTGHGFFAVDRPAYRVASANDGWERIAAFYAVHLGG